MPPIKQAEYELILANVYYGSGKPEFKEVFAKIFRKLNIESLAEMILDRGLFRSNSNQFFFVADFKAKNAILNMKQYNGFYGCNIRDLRSKHENGAHKYFNESKKVTRTADSYLNSLQAALDRNWEKRKIRNTSFWWRKVNKGNLGASKIYSVITYVPLTAPCISCWKKPALISLGSFIKDCHIKRKMKLTRE